MLFRQHWRTVRLQCKQFGQRWPVQTRSNKRQSLVALQCSREKLQDSPGVSGRLNAAHGPAFGPVIEQVEDQTFSRTTKLEHQFGPLRDEPVDEILERSEQVHVALSALTEVGQVELPRGRCGRPSRGTREVEGAGAPIREKHSKTTATLDEDIKTAALEALVPSELEQHRAMNRARLLTYDQVRGEVQAHI